MKVSPGAAEMCYAWAASWPKLLFYIGASDPTLSTFLLAILLDLAKRAVQAGSIHERLFAEIRPLLVPFFIGVSKDDKVRRKSWKP